MRYVVAVQANAYPVSGSEFAVESAFAEHLRELRRSIGAGFESLVLVAPTMPEDEFQAQRQHLTVLRQGSDGISLVPGHPQDASPYRFWRFHARRLVRETSIALADGGVVHSGMSTDVWRPLMALVNLVGLIRRQPVVFFVDIDFRLHSPRLYRLGLWSRRDYLVNRIVHDRLKLLQLWLAPRLFDLVMLKSRSMVRDFGKGRDNVKNFFDVAHAAAHVISEGERDSRIAAIGSGRPLRLAYFGRLAVNKGVDRMIAALAQASAAGADVHLSVIGDGPCLEELRRTASTLRVDDRVSFVPQVRYGAELFSLLEKVDVSLAAPLVEDTPRSAFDSLARGLPLIAFDISYFRDLADMSGAVALARWPSATAMAERIVDLDRDRAQLQRMIRRGVAFAAENTQEIWLARRADWMRRYAMRSASTIANGALAPVGSADTSLTGSC